MSDDQLLSRVTDDFLTRARAAGHPILSMFPGRWCGPDTCPIPADDATPNDLIEQAREMARAGQDWVHALMPAAAEAVRLAAALQPAPAIPQQARHLASPSATGAAWTRLLRRPVRIGTGDPRRVPFHVLVAEIPLTVVTLTVYRDGYPVHVVEIPAPWLTCPLAKVTP